MKKNGKIFGITFVLLGVAAFLAYLPSLNAEFLNWDDQLYVLDNPYIQSIDWRFLKVIFTEAIAANWHPLTIFSHAVDYAIWGLDPFGHHLTNALLHSLNTALVFWLSFEVTSAAPGPGALRYRGRLIAAAAAALLFGLHPLHVESVAWVAERKDLLSGFFFVISLLCYLKYARSSSGGRLRYSAALLFFALAIMSKPMAITLPVVLLILDFYPLDRFRADARRAIIEKVPFFAVSAFSAAVTVWAQNKGGALASIDAHPLSERVAVAVNALAAYIYKMLWPANLAPFYPIPKGGAIFGPLFFISLLFLAAVTVFCLFALKRRKRVYAAVWASYLITLLPVIGLVQVGNQSMADRYTYIPSMGLFMLAGASIAVLYERLHGGARAALAFICVLWIALLAGRTLQQEHIWKDSLSLWNHEIALYPEVALGYNNRGQAYEKLNLLDKALADFNRAVQVKPEYADAYYNRALINQKMGRFEAAIRDYDFVLLQKTGVVKAYINRGVSYAMLKEFGRAIRDFKKAAELDPSIPVVYFYLGLSYSEVGEQALARYNFKKASQMGFKEADGYLD
ncbi:MAG: tetratricopeptide repeat protein [Thermodesulfobacteriota bacterium]